MRSSTSTLSGKAASAAWAAASAGLGLPLPIRWSISSRREVGSAGSALTALSSQSVVSAGLAPLRAPISARASIAPACLGLRLSTATKRARAAAGCFSLRSSAARPASAGMKSGLLATAFSKCLRAPAASLRCSAMRPRSWSGRASPGILAARVSMAFKAPVKSLARTLALINARSAVLPLSAAAMDCNSASAFASWPLPSCDKAMVVRRRLSVGASLAALAKLASAALLSPDISWACAVSVIALTSGGTASTSGLSTEIALSIWPLRKCTWANW